MPEEQLKPTIANPFAKPARPSHKKVPIIKATSNRPTSSDANEPPFQRNRNFVPSPYEAERLRAGKDIMNPGFFVSAATKEKIKAELEKGTVLEVELPHVFEISAMIATILNRQSPSLSDIEVGLAFKTRENMKKIVEGEIDVDIVRRNYTSEVLARTERIKFWREVARITLENLLEKKS